MIFLSPVVSVDDIRVQISNERVTFEFLFPSGQQSKGFIQDVQRASDSARNMVGYGHGAVESENGKKWPKMAEKWLE